MTAQFAERLLYQGENYAMCTNPLTDYFELGGDQPRFVATSTALWRGYIGSWEIVDKRLYLVALEGVLQGGASATLETVFPGFPDRVFAHWYSGTVRLPRGELLNYVHGGYASTFEMDILLDFERGILTGGTVRHNKPSHANSIV